MYKFNVKRKKQTYSPNATNTAGKPTVHFQTPVRRCTLQSHLYTHQLESVRSSKGSKLCAA